MNFSHLTVKTDGEGFYDITEEVKNKLNKMTKPNQKSGVLHLIITHTSCALTINEAFDPSAAKDMEEFLKYLAPRNLPFIKHTAEGPDDSPSHMKSILLNHSLTLIIDAQEIMLGQWQGIYLAEFRDHKKERKVLLKFQAD